jgi:hypothetical protein
MIDGEEPRAELFYARPAGSLRTISCRSEPWTAGWLEAVVGDVRFEYFPSGDLRPTADLTHTGRAVFVDPAGPFGGVAWASPERRFTLTLGYDGGDPPFGEVSGLTAPEAAAVLWSHMRGESSKL